MELSTGPIRMSLNQVLPLFNRILIDCNIRLWLCHSPILLHLRVFLHTIDWNDKYLQVYECAQHEQAIPNHLRPYEDLNSSGQINGPNEHCTTLGRNIALCCWCIFRGALAQGDEDRQYHSPAQTQKQEHWIVPYLLKSCTAVLNHTWGVAYTFNGAGNLLVDGQQDTVVKHAEEAFKSN